MSLRISVCDALAAIGPEAKPAVPALAAALADARELAPERLTYLHEVGPSVRGSAALALASIGNDAEAAVPALIQAVRSDRSLARRQQYIGALCAIGPRAVRPLVQALRNPEPAVQISAIVALRGMATSLREALPDLVKELDNDAVYQLPDRRIQTVGDEVSSLIAREGRSCVPILSNAMVDPGLTSATRVRAAAVFSKLAPADSAAAIPVLIEGLKDARLRDVAAVALGDLGRRARGASAALALAAEREDFCYTACAAVARVDPENRAVHAMMNRLEAELNAADWRKRLCAVEALVLFGPAPSICSPARSAIRRKS